MNKSIQLPITAEVASKLHAGDYVYLNGVMYVARDAAHKRMIESLEKKEGLPIDLLYGAFSRKRRKADWLCRSHNRLQNG